MPAVLRCRSAMYVLSQPFEILPSVKQYSTFTIYLVPNAFYTYFHQALTLCLGASGWCEFAHGRSLRASLWCSHPSFFLSLTLTPSTPCLSLPLTPFQLFYPSQWTPSGQSASVTLLQDIQVELWPMIQAGPKLSHDLKQQINLQQITCQTPAGEDVRSLFLPKNSWERR